MSFLKGCTGIVDKANEMVSVLVNTKLAEELAEHIIYLKHLGEISNIHTLKKILLLGRLEGCKEWF